MLSCRRYVKRNTDFTKKPVFKKETRCCLVNQCGESGTENKKPTSSHVWRAPGDGWGCHMQVQERWNLGMWKPRWRNPEASRGGGKKRWTSAGGADRIRLHSSCSSRFGRVHVVTILRPYIEVSYLNRSHVNNVLGLDDNNVTSK